MKHMVKKRSLFILMIMLCLWFGPQTVFAAGDTTTILVDVTYGQTDARSMLEMINDFRTGSEAWYWNSDNTTKTTCTGLTKLTYDYGLEKAAMQRAAEIALYWSHTRPDGSSCKTAAASGYGGYVGENIAAGYRTVTEAFEGWAETDELYAGQGHRRNMLSSNYTAVGIGHVYYRGYHYWVQEFSNTVNTTAVTANDSETTVSIDILNSNFTATPASEQGEYVLVIGESDTVPVGVQMNAEISGRWPIASCNFMLPCTWTVTDSSIAAISGTQLTGNRIGTTTLKTIVSGTEVSIPVTVQCKIHTVVTIPAVEATCTEKGKTAGQKCSKCDSILKEQEEIAALGHAEVQDAAVAATCTTSGLTAGSHCSRCDEVFTEQEEIAALGHLEVQDAAVAATCTTSGLTAGSHCSRCNEVLEEQEEIAALGHTEVQDAAVAATCTTSGLTAGSHCSRCNVVFEEQEVIPELGHAWDAGTVTTEPTFTENGVKEYRCSRCDEIRTTLVPATGNNSEFENAEVILNENSFLYDGTEKCPEVVKLSIDEMEVDAEYYTVTYENNIDVGTAYVVVTAKAPCTGSKKISYTIYCNHEKTLLKNVKSATATVAGYSGDKCCVSCGTVLEKGQTIPAIGVSGGNTNTKPQDNNSNKEPSQENTQDNEPVAPEEGTELTASDGAKYLVTNSDSDSREVEYAKPATQNASNISIPATITIEGISYKVTSIDEEAFIGNNKITKVTIGNNIKGIGNAAFKNCKKLNSVIMGSKVEDIGDSAFEGCKKLTQITISSKVEEIGKKAFYNCKKLKKITIKSNKLESIGNLAFKGIYKNALIRVPSKKLNVYKKLFTKKTGYKKTMRIKK